MAARKALTRHGAIVECGTHKRKCPVCWACWLSDRLETSIYQDDLEDIFTLSNAFTTVVKPGSIVYEETASVADDS